jgi:hypothetical protein
MDRRTALLGLLGATVVTVAGAPLAFGTAGASPAALPRLTPLLPTDGEPQPAVATEADLDTARIEHVQQDCRWRQVGNRRQFVCSSRSRPTQRPRCGWIQECGRGTCRGRYVCR